MSETISTSNKYRSQFERHIAESNPDLVYEPCQIKYTLECDYTPDWVMPNGVYIETKGNFTADDRRKILQVMKQHPDLDLRLVFMSDNWLSRRHQCRYSDWCKKYKIPYSIGYIPASWYE